MRQHAGWCGLGGLALRVQAPLLLLLLLLHLQEAPHLLLLKGGQPGQTVAQSGRRDGLPGLVSLSNRLVLLLLLTSSSPILGCQIVHIIISSFTLKIFHIIENMTSRVSNVENSIINIIIYLYCVTHFPSDPIPHRKAADFNFRFKKSR